MKTHTPNRFTPKPAPTERSAFWRNLTQLVLPLLLLLGLLFFSSSLKAQEIRVTGDISGPMGHSAVGYQVLVEIDTLPANGTPFRIATVATNGSGIYDQRYICPPGLQMQVKLTVDSCMNTFRSRTQNVTVPQTGIVSVLRDFTVCNPAGPSCDASFDKTVSGLQATVFPLFAYSSTAVYDWDMGDGTQYNGQFQVTHTYAAPGTYPVKLTLGDAADGCYDIKTQQIVIGGGGPTPLPSLKVDGGVYTSQSQAVSNQLVQIVVDTFPMNAFPLIAQNVNTNSIGQFSHVFQNLPRGLMMHVRTSTDTCNGATDFRFQSVQMPQTGQAAQTQVFFKCGPALPTCNAGFQRVVTNNLTVQVYPTTAYNAAYSYNWDMGDGNTYTTFQVNHTYLNPGHYTVTLTVNTNSGCTQTSQQTFLLSGGSNPNISVLNLNGVVQSHLGTGVSGQQVYVEIDTFPANLTPIVAQWVTTNLVGSYSQNFNVPANTQLAVSVRTDTCSGTDDIRTSTVQSVATGTLMLTEDFTTCSATAPSCDASWGGQTWGTRVKLQTYLPPSATATLTWTMGDNTVLTGNPITHVYSAPGTYSVTLTLSDVANNCSQTLTQAVVVDTVGQHSPVSSFEGQIKKPNLPNAVVLADVYIIQSTPGPQGSVILTAVDTVQTDSLGYYYADNLAAGNYYVKAALRTNDPNYGNFIPSYYAGAGNSLTWLAAATVNVNPLTQVTADINITPGLNPGGPGFIGGNVQQGANKMDTQGAPVEDVTVLLINSTGTVRRFAISDAAGNFSLNGLPYGTYTLFADAYGRTTSAHTVVLSANSANKPAEIIYVTGNNGNTGVENPVGEVTGSLYPNPVETNAEWPLALRQETEVRVEVLDLNGRVLLNVVRNLPTGRHKLQLNLTDLPSGIYIGRMSAQDQLLGTTRFIKK